MPEIQSRKMGYADDWMIATQHEKVCSMENIPTADLEKIINSFRKWRL